MLANIGLVIITLGWLFQIGSITKKKHELNMIFVAAYIVGVTMLIIDGITNQLLPLAGLNGLTLMAAGIAWWKIKK